MKIFIFVCLLAVAFAKHKMDYRSSSVESAIISQEKFKQGKNMIIHPSEDDTHLTSCKETTENTEEVESSSSSSSEETVDVSSEKNTLTEEEKYYLKHLNKINQFYQALNPLHVQAFRQHQIVTNPWTHIRKSVFPLVHILNREQFFSSEEPASISQEQYKQDKDEFMHNSQDTTKRTADMESSSSSSTEESTEVITEKTKLTEEEKNYLKQLKKVYQYYQTFPIPQYLNAGHQYQAAINPWNYIKTNAYQIGPIPVLLKF